MPSNPTKRVQSQSTEEWINNYERDDSHLGHDKVTSNLYKPWIYDGRPLKEHLSWPTQNTSPVLKYAGHRTTKNGSLILSFIDQLTFEEVIIFFNVDIRRQRGPDKGKRFKTGNKGRFLPPPRGKFRQFWMYFIGKEPSRWALTYKHLNSAMKNLIFTGDFETAIRSNGSKYTKVKNLKLIQKSNN